MDLAPYAPVQIKAVTRDKFPSARAVRRPPLAAFVSPYSLADYWLTSVGVGIRSVVGPYPRYAAARIVNPLSYPRMMEYSLVRDMLGGMEGKTVLDIGSPKLPALLIGRDRTTTLFATDIRDYFVAPTEHLLRCSGLGDRVGRGVHLQTADARDLPFEDNSFDAVFSISVLEHIPDEGDSAAMREISRVLKPGAAVALTVPFDAARYWEERLSGDVYERSFHGESVFYQRHYDESALFSRLVQSSGLGLERIQYFGEPGLRFEPTWNRIPMKWKIPLLWAQPFIAHRFLKRLPPGDISRACGAALLLRKSPVGSSDPGRPAPSETGVLV